jgi:hypothetical protein
VITAGDDDAQTRQLIDANLKMEEDRKFVMSMCQDQQGCLWVGTEGGGVQRFDPRAPELHQWKEFTTKDGLGDDYAYALACDRLGRVWVGHLNHGVSVFNGQKWQNYEVVGGLSRPDTLSGPIGERVFAIKVCPTDGDVWIATNAGLARYSENQDAWQYYTQADGLPSDQLQAIAFDASGNIYVGTQCEGLARADASAAYRNWTIAQAPEFPGDASQSSLPSNLINDVLVTRAGSIYVATDAGLARSNDRGQSWTPYFGSYHLSRPAEAHSPFPLAEDYCTCLAEDAHQQIWVGHRQEFPDSFDGNMRTAGHSISEPSYVTAILQAHRGLVAATYGDGLLALPSPRAALEADSVLAASSLANLPSGAVPPQEGELRKLLAKHASPPPPNSAQSKVVVLPDDWRTQGEWLGRYGRYTAILAAMSNPGDYVWGAGGEPATYNVRIAPQFSDRDSVRYWRHWLYTTNPKSLEIPPVYLDSRIAHGWTTPDVNRRESEWDDHGEAYPQALDGPDLYCTIRIPSGRFRLSLYDFNKDGHEERNRFRDYEVSLWEHPADADLSDVSSVGARHALARSRIKDFWGSLYKNFAVQGPLCLTVQVRRNHSINAILAGVFLDTFEERPAPYFPATPELAAPSINVSDSAASDDEFLSQLQNRTAGSLVNLAQNRICYVMLLRHLLAEQRSEPISKRSPQIGTCYFALNQFDHWEACQRQQGLIPARDIEKSLKLDRSIPAYSGRGHQTVVECLQKKPTPPIGRPSEATAQ